MAENNKVNIVLVFGHTVKKHWDKYEKASKGMSHVIENIEDARTQWHEVANGGLCKEFNKEDIHDDEVWFALSYPHTKQPYNYNNKVPISVTDFCNAAYSVLHSLKLDKHLLPRFKKLGIRIWWDMIYNCRVRRYTDELDWISHGLIPYTIMPAIVICISGGNDGYVNYFPMNRSIKHALSVLPARQTTSEKNENVANNLKISDDEINFAEVRFGIVPLDNNLHTEWDKETQLLSGCDSIWMNLEMECNQLMGVYAYGINQQETEYLLTIMQPGLNMGEQIPTDLAAASQYSSLLLSKAVPLCNVLAHDYKQNAREVLYGEATDDDIHMQTNKNILAYICLPLALGHYNEFRIAYKEDKNKMLQIWETEKNEIISKYYNNPAIITSILLDWATRTNAIFSRQKIMKIIRENARKPCWDGIKSMPNVEIILEKIYISSDMLKRIDQIVFDNYITLEFKNGNWPGHLKWLLEVKLYDSIHNTYGVMAMRLISVHKNTNNKLGYVNTSGVIRISNKEKEYWTNPKKGTIKISQLDNCIQAIYEDNTLSNIYIHLMGALSSSTSIGNIIANIMMKTNMQNISSTSTTKETEIRYSKLLVQAILCDIEVHTQGIDHYNNLIGNKDKALLV